MADTPQDRTVAELRRDMLEARCGALAVEVRALRATNAERDRHIGHLYQQIAALARLLSATRVA